jgi:hypothetical protein
MSRRARIFRAFLGAAVLAAPATALPAQARPVQRVDATVPRAYGDLTFTVSQPVGAFNDFISEGYGLSGGVVWNLDRDRVFGIRLEGGYLQYDHERKSACLSSTIGCRIQVDVNTSNDIVFAGIGPQLTVPAGPVRPYLNATAGLGYFYTHSSVRGRDAYDDQFETTNHDDAVFALTGGGGFLIPLSMRRTPVLLDLGATFHRNGEATYLRRDSIRDNPDGSIVVTPIRSEANFITYRIGVSIGMSMR